MKVLEMTATTSVRRLKNFLIMNGSRCGTGISKSYIDQFEVKYRVKIPNDFKAYFTDLNGTADDNACRIVRFWSINECRPLNKVIQESTVEMAVIQSTYDNRLTNGDGYFVFADYMDEMQLYVINLSDTEQPNTVVVLDGTEPRIVAKSFTEFVERFISSPGDLQLEVD